MNRIIITANLLHWQHALPVTLSDGRFAAWCAGEPLSSLMLPVDLAAGPDSPVHEVPAAPFEAFPTLAAAQAAYPELTVLEGFASAHVTAPVVSIMTPLALMERLTDAEKLAIFTSTDAGVVIFRNMAVAAQEIRSDDERTVDGLAYLEHVGVLAPGRSAELLTL
ncbi:MAG: hypothetical protein WC661_10230 [Opitutaceae bacterium]|jgi:hypothetical protein